MQQYALYRMINPMAETVTNPYQRIALLLSFMRGPKVDDWVAEKVQQLELAVRGDPAAGIPPTALMTDERLWVDFLNHFQASFVDSAAQQNAYAELQSCRMEKGKLDEYVAKFETVTGTWDGSYRVLG